MKLNIKTEYACLAVVYLAKQYNKGMVTSKTLGAQFDIPLKYLEQILLSLKQGGFVKSSRGANGGYCLRRSPRTISVAEVLRYMNGPIASVKSVSKYFYEFTPIERHKALKDLFQDIRNYTSQKLENTKFGDLI